MGLLNSIKLHEGFRKDAYQDTKGIWTIGYGTNLQVLSIDEQLAAKWLYAKIAEATAFVDKWHWDDKLDPMRREVVVEMIYNLGPEFGDEDGFKDWPKFVGQVREGRYKDAADNMRATLWASQVGLRARRLAAQMEFGLPWDTLHVS